MKELTPFKKILFTLGLLIVLYVAYAVASLLYDSYRTQKNIERFGKASSVSTYEQLLAKNPDFVTGDGYLKGKRGAEAIVSFTKALAVADNNFEKSQIEFKIADGYSLTGDYKTAITILKGIVKNPNYTPDSKSYSAYFIAQLYSTFSTPEVIETVYNSGDEPYVSMYKEKDVLLAQRRLYEYASSFKIYAPAEFRIAAWYTRTMVKHPEQFTPETKKAALEEVYKRIDSGNISLEQIKLDQNLVGQYGQALVTKAFVLADLKSMGEKITEDPEDVMKEAVKVSVTGANAEASLKYNYALYLARFYGETRKGDISKLLQDFYLTKNYNTTPTVRFFKNEKDNTLNSNGQKDILLLASVDRDFATYLRGFGWKIKQ